MVKLWMRTERYETAKSPHPIRASWTAPHDRGRTISKRIAARAIRIG